MKNTMMHHTNARLEPNALVPLSSLTLHSYHPIVPSAYLPETTPANIMLTQILQIRRLTNQPTDLINHILLFTRSAIFAREFLLDARKDL
jgi:hypothetical protein